MVCKFTPKQHIGDVSLEAILSGMLLYLLHVVKGLVDKSNHAVIFDRISSDVLLSMPILICVEVTQRCFVS